MYLFTIITILVVLSAIFGYINVRFLKLPTTIGLMMMAVIFSAIMLSLNVVAPKMFHFAEDLVEQIDFSEVVLNVMLSFLLFAGALHTDISLLKKEKGAISMFALGGVLLSTFLTAGLFYGIGMVLGHPIDFIHCLLFGALISPTDPIAVLGILKQSKVPKRAEIRIVGESLFNDGVAVVFFLGILEIIHAGVENVSAGDIILLFLQEAGGGIVFGLILGYVMFRLLKSIDHYETEVMITLAMVMGGYLFASWLHISGPLAMVVAGLYTGSRSKELAMSDTTKKYVDQFWELVDVLMNAVLFVLIGLELMVVDFDSIFIWIGLLAIPAVLLARYIAIRIPSVIVSKWLDIDRKTVVLMTWGGLRGGISIAMALSLTREAEKDMFVTVTYIIVLFSILVQGLTLSKVAKRLYRTG